MFENLMKHKPGSQIHRLVMEKLLMTVQENIHLVCSSRLGQKEKKLV